MDIYQSLNIAIRLTVDNYCKNQKISKDEIAHRLGYKSPQVFKNELCATNRINKFGTEKLLDLMLLTGDRSVLRVYDNILNSLESRSGNAEVTERDVMELLIRSQVNLSQITKVFHEVMEDGVVTQSECKKLCELTGLLHKSQDSFIETVMGMVGNGGLRSVA